MHAKYLEGNDDFVIIKAVYPGVSYEIRVSAEKYNHFINDLEAVIHHQGCADLPSVIRLSQMQAIDYDCLRSHLVQSCGYILNSNIVRKK